MTHSFQQFYVTAYAEDVDRYCQVTPQAYLRFMDRARVEGIEALCREGQIASWLDQYVVNVYKITARFGAPAYNGERLSVVSSLHKTSSHRAVYLQRVLNPSGQMAAEAYIELLFLDGQSKTLVPVPDMLPMDELPKVTSGRPLVPVPFGQADHFNFSWPIRVYYEDTDAQGITYHVSYFNFCERAFIEYLRQVVGPESLFTWMNSHPMKISRQINRYMNATHLAEKLQIMVGLRALDENTLLLDERVINDAGQVCTDMMTEFCFTTNGQLQPIPAPLAAVLDK